MTIQEQTRDAWNKKGVAEERRSRLLAGGDARERLLAEMPVTERRLQKTGVSTAVLEGGAGPPVVLLHVIENAADDPPIEQPEALLRALRAAFGFTEGEHR